MKVHLPLAISGLIMVSACVSDVGVRVEDFKPAHTPAGASTEVLFRRGIVKGNKLHGELLVVADEAVTLLLSQPLETPAGRRRFIEARFESLRSINVDQLGSATVKSQGEALDDARLSRLRALSRFPQGLSEELREKLLATYGEIAIYVPTAETGPDP